MLFKSEWCGICGVRSGTVAGFYPSTSLLPVNAYSTDRSTVINHTTTSRKVAGSIPDEVIGFFNWPNPSSLIMALGSTQPLTEMSTSNLPGWQRAAGAWDWQPHRHLWADCIENVVTSTSHNPMGLHGLLQGHVDLLLTESSDNQPTTVFLLEHDLHSGQYADVLLVSFRDRRAPVVHTGNLIIVWRT
jgi:hypothetical protein